MLPSNDNDRFSSILFVLAMLFSIASVTPAAAASSTLPITPELFISAHDDSKVIKVDTSTNTVTDPFVPAGSGGLSRALSA